MSNRRRRRPDRFVQRQMISIRASEPENFFTDEDRAGMVHVMDLEAAGDLEGALRELRRQTRVVGAAHERHLAEMVRLGDSAPAWAWARWTVGAAYRWALLNADPRTDRAVLAVFAATYLDDPAYSYDLGTSIAACDALVGDLVVFDLGVLGDYLDVRAGERLLDRAARVRDWVGSEPSVFRLRALRGDRLVLADTVTGRELSILHTGEAMGTSRDEWVLGRVVPAAGDELVFASRPLTVGPQAGPLLRDAVAAGGGWEARLGALHQAISEHRLSAGPGWLAGSTHLTCGGSLRDDAAWEDPSTQELPPAPRVQELLDEGLSRQTADHLCVLELALEAARQDLSGAAEMVAQHAAIALLWPEVRQEAARRYVGPELSALWRRLGSCLPPHARQPFDALADAA
jgi:hypothetical protein